MADRFDVVVVLGSDYTDITTGSELAFNAQVAANLGSPVVLVVSGQGRDPRGDRGCRRPGRSGARRAARPPGGGDREPGGPRRRWTRCARCCGRRRPGGRRDPGDCPLLIAPSVAQLIAACDGRVVRGDSAGAAGQGVDGVRRRGDVAAERADPAARRLHGDRPGRPLRPAAGLVLAHYAGTFPTVASIVLTGGYPPPDSVQRLIDGLRRRPADHGRPSWAPSRRRRRSARARGKLRADSTVKVETALRVFAESVDVDALIRASSRHSEATTPLMFQLPADRPGPRGPIAHIVLPEGDDDRILQATDSLLRLGVADITILGDEETPCEGARADPGVDAGRRAGAVADTIRNWSSGSPRSTSGCASTRG